MTDIRTSSTPPKTKIFVGRLPEDAQAQDLRKLFEQYGVVTECDILNRYGFVHMKTEEMAAQAIRELNNTEFMGAQISVEQSTGKKSGRGAGAPRGGFGPMRGRGNFRGMGRAPPYIRDGRNDFERRPGFPPPPGMRNGFYETYDRGEPDRRPYPDMIRSPYERRTFTDLGRSPYDRPALPPVSSFDRRTDYGAPRVGTDIYRRRTPPPPATGYTSIGYERDPIDPYGPTGRSYERDGIDPFGLPGRRFPPAAQIDREMPPRRF